MDEAIAWHVGLEGADASDWHRFVVWLEASPGHAAAYDRLVGDDAALPATLAGPRPAMPVRAGRWIRWGRWGGAGGIVAAAIAAWLLVVPARLDPSTYDVVTAPGQRRNVALPDGTRIELNGATRVTLDRSNPRLAVLDQGEAVFSVVHDPRHPFEVHSGAVTLRDVGTVFNVARNPAGLNVAVAEGEVLYAPEQDAVSLRKGMALALRDGEDRVVVSHVNSAAVGGWRQGRLEYRDVALETVAADVGRSTGTRIHVSPEMASRPFTGTLRLNRPSEDVVRSLAELADGEVHRDGRAWQMRPRSIGALP